MVQYEPEVLARALRRQPSSLGSNAESRGIGALQFPDGASDLEGVNPLAPLPFLGEKTVGFIRTSFMEAIHYGWQ